MARGFVSVHAAEDRAQATIGQALGLVAPGAVTLADGRVRLPDAREYLGRRVLRRFGKRLARRASDQISDQRLLVEAVALLGAELRRSRGGVAADGATQALDSLLDHPGLPPAVRADGQALLRSILQQDDHLSESGLERALAAQTPRRPGAPLLADTKATTHAIRLQTTQLAPQLTQPAAPAATPEATAPQATRPAGSATSHSSPPAAPPSTAAPRATTPSSGFFGAVRDGYRGRRQARRALAENRYNEFRTLSDEWEATRGGRGSRELAVVEGELKALQGTIIRSGAHVPALPWRHQQAAQPADVTPMSALERLRTDVQAQINGLDLMANTHARRATVRADSAEKARTDAAETLELAAAQGALPDQSADYRSWTLTRRSQHLQKQAGRHDTIAALSHAAADQATAAANTYRTLLTELDAPAPDVTPLLDTAEQQIERLQTAAANTAPRRDVQHTGHPYGRFPHLSALAHDLNEELADRGATYRFTPDVLHRWLRAETHRVIAPDGVVLTVPGDARDKGGNLLQFQIHLDPGELEEVLGGDIVLDESRSGQLGQLAFVTGSTATYAQSQELSGGLQTAMAALPDSNALKAVGQFVSPSATVSSTQRQTIAMGQQDSPQPGQVEALYGELLLYRSTNPSYRWRVRGAGRDWSQPRTIAAGTANDTSTLDLAYSHTYTVPPPTDTIVLDDLGLSPADRERERLTDLPEHVGLRADGVDHLCDRTLAALRERGVVLDRTGTSELSGLIVEDGIAAMEETSRRGGVDGVITTGGRPVAYVRHESFPVLETAEPISTSSDQHSVEFWRVGNSATSSSVTNADSTTRAASIGYGGPGTSNLAGTGVDAGPGASVGRGSSTQDTVSLAGLGSRWSTQRLGPTVALRVRMERRVTVQLLDQDESFGVEGSGSADLRMLERDALRYGLPVPPDAVVRGPDNAPLRGIDGRLLLRGDPQPATENLGLPIWLGDGPGQLRGAGPAMVRDLEGFELTRQALYTKFHDDGLIPAVDQNGRPVLSDLVDRDEAEVVTLLRNLKRVNVTFAKHRLETAYNHGTQIREQPSGPQPDGGVLFELTEHRTGHLAKLRTYRLTIAQDFDRAQLLGVTDTDTMANVDFAMDSVNRARGYSTSTPWGLSLGFGRKPAAGTAGASAEAKGRFGRTSRGRSVTSAEGDELYQMVLSESRDPVAVFKIPHTLMVSEVLPDGSSAPLTSEEGSARIYLDSSMCNRGEAPTMAVAGRVERDLLRSAAASIHHLDARDPDGQVARAVPELGRGDQQALLHLASRLAVQNQMTRLELLADEYRDDLMLTAPDDALAALAHRGLEARRSSLAVRAHLENVKYVSSGHQFVGMLNIPAANVSYTAGASSGTSLGLSVGAGYQGAGGASGGGTVGAARVKSKSASVTEAVSDAPERSVLRSGEHYTLWADLVLAAELRHGGADVRPIELDRGGVVMTVPEEHALAAYTRGKLELPPAKVADAVQRLLDGNLSLPRRTTTALLRRYATLPAADRPAEHTSERIADLARRVAGLASADPRLQQTLAAADAITNQSVAVSTPPGYAAGMAWSVSDGPLLDDNGQVVDVLAEARTAVEEHVPGALDRDPVLASALYGVLGGERAAGVRDQMTDPLGFSRPLPLGDQRDLRVRVRLEFAGPVTVDGGDRSEGAASRTFNYRSDWRLRTDSTSATATTAYDASVGASGGAGSSGANGAVGASTEVTTSTTATSTRTGYRISPAAALKTEWAERRYRLTIDVTDEPRTPFGGRTRKDRLRKPRTTQRVIEGVMPVTIPSAHVDVPEPLQVIDHRVVTPPASAVVESVVPYPAADAAAPVNRIHEAVVKRAGRRDLLTERGAAMHRQALEKLFGGSGLLTKLPEMIGPHGYTTPPLPLPRSTSETVRITLWLGLSNARIVSNPDVDQPVQLGENTRQTNADKISVESNSELPTTYTVGGTDGASGVSASMSSTEQATASDLSATGWRHEVGLLGTAQLVSVEFTAGAHARFERFRNGRLMHSVDEHTIAEGTVTLGMPWSAYQALLVELEEGRRQQTDLDPSTAHVRRIHVELDHDPQHPYQPIVDAARHATSAGVDVELTVRNQDGTTRTYDLTQDGRSNDGFAAALIRLHPQLVELAESTQVDLHGLYLATRENGRFGGAVVADLQLRGVPASALDGIDSRSVQAIRARVEQDPTLEEAAQRGTGTGTDGVAIV